MARPGHTAPVMIRANWRSSSCGFQQSAADRKELVPSFFRTHPYHRERYEAVLQCYQELMKAEPRADLYVGTQNLRERVPRSKRAFEERAR